MDYKFPHIEHLDQVREAIQGRPEFIIAERDWGYVANYNVNFEDTFNDMSEIGLIRRECRGIKFDLKGNIIARPFHKFFNLNERNETQLGIVDFDRSFAILDKLDGSMVHPICLGEIDDRNLVWCTKMGPTDVAVPVQKFVERNEHYARYAAHVMANGYTPIFEWCSRSQRIVVDYPQDMLVLTAMRDNVTGEYLPYEELVKAETHNIQVVRRWNGDFNGISDFLKEVQTRENEEGYVLRFDNGHMLKVKNLWYVQLHKTKELMQHEKDVWALVLDDKVDDARAFMEQEDQDRLSAFQKDLIGEIRKTSERLWWEVVAWKDNNGDGKKKFAVEFVNSPNAQFKAIEKGILFKVFDGINQDETEELVTEIVRKNLGTNTKLESVRHLANNLRWSNE